MLNDVDKMTETRPRTAINLPLTLPAALDLLPVKPKSPKPNGAAEKTQGDCSGALQPAPPPNVTASSRSPISHLNSGRIFKEIFFRFLFHVVAGDLINYNR